MRLKTGFSVLKKLSFVLKMRAQIKGYLGQMAHRRQIAQWSGTRTTYPGEAGFETGPCPKPGCESACFPQGLFPPPKKRPWVFRHPKRSVFIENLGIACPHFRRVFFGPPKTRPWVFLRPKRLISSSRNSPTSPRWSPY